MMRVPDKIKFAPKICRSHLSALITMLDFALKPHADGWTQQAATPTGLRNTLVLVFKYSITNVMVSAKNPFPRSNY